MLVLAPAQVAAAADPEGSIACEIERWDGYNNHNRIERPGDGDLDINVNHRGLCKAWDLKVEDGLPGVTMTSATRAFLGPEDMCLVAAFPNTRSISYSAACYEFPGDLPETSKPATASSGLMTYQAVYTGDFFGSVRCSGATVDCRQGGIIHVVTFVTFSIDRNRNLEFVPAAEPDPFEVTADPYGRFCAESPPIAEGYSSYTCALTNEYLTTGYYPVPPQPEQDPRETARRNVDKAEDTAEDNGVPSECNSPMCP